MADPADTYSPPRFEAPDALAVKALLLSTPAPGSVNRLSSQAVFAGAREVEIDHNGAVYRLRQTALGKLILTK